MSYPNAHNYPDLEAEKFQPTGNRALLKWEEKKGTLLKGKLVTPERNKRQHYTGIVLKVSDDIDSMEVGDRVVFEQFSGFEKFFDPKHGRLALISEPAALAKIPKRHADKVKVDIGEPGYEEMD